MHQVVIDQGTKEGFKCVANAREYLLEKGKKSITKAAASALGDTPDQSTPDLNPKLGSHVVAPVSEHACLRVTLLTREYNLQCPHDGVCPLSLPTSRQHCFFVQRLNRPAYLRKTKHATRGQEDVQYSYVVIRRGPRPAPVDIPTAPPAPPAAEKAPDRKLVEVGGAAPGETVHMEWQDVEVEDDSRDNWVPRTRDSEEMRHEAYSWPRIIYLPIKRSGHVILDTCTKDGPPTLLRLY